jgi:hypothetical protein
MVKSYRSISQSLQRYAAVLFDSSSLRSSQRTIREYHLAVLSESNETEKASLNIDKKNPSNTAKGDLLLHRATSFDPTMGSSSGQRLNKN